MTPDLLVNALGLRDDLAATWARPLSETMDRYGMATTWCRAAFLAQAAHESDGFTALVENMNYSAAALLATWPIGRTRDGRSYGYFNTVNAGAYAYQPQRIANLAYAGRDGNGDEDSGDGWKFRGRGPFQTTGRGSYQAFGLVCQQDLVASPDLLLRPDLGAWCAGWEWNSRNLNHFAALHDFDTITRRINGGTLGEPDRLARFERVLKALS